MLLVVIFNQDLTRRNNYSATSFGVKIKFKNFLLYIKKKMLHEKVEDKGASVTQWML